MSNSASVCDIERVIEAMKGVACICASLSISVEAGSLKYQGAEMALLCDVLESAISDLERALP